MTVPTWWQDPTTDWRAAEPSRVVDVLTYAYPRLDDVQRTASAVGLDDTTPTDLPVREAWTTVLGAASARGRVLDLAAHVLHDLRVSPFHAPFRLLLGDLVDKVNLRIVTYFGLPPEPAEGPDTLLESLRRATSDDDGPGRLQAVVSAAQGMPHLRTQIQAELDLLHRTAMIEIGGVPAGTGFLVGDTLLLTAAHVFDRHRWPPDPVPHATAVFDYDFAGRSYAESGTRVDVVELISGLLPTESEAAGTVGADWDAPDDRLDFALVRLAGPVPNPPRLPQEPRGYYALRQEDYNYTATAEYLIAQHAAGDYLHSTRIGSPRVSKRRTRMRYGGNTLPGASGSAIIDPRGRLVGLHHYGGDWNQGVPIAAIAARLLTGDHAGLFHEGAPTGPGAATLQVDPFVTTAIMSLPFVNRRNLRSTVRRMAEGDARRTLAVVGASSRAGVSHSYTFTAHVAKHALACPSLRAAAPRGIEALRIDLRLYIGRVAGDRIRTEIGLKLLKGLRIIAPTDTDAQAARETLTLVDAVEARLRASAEQWWIFFDSVDNMLTVKQGQVDELIHALITLAGDEQVPLRVVVGGLEAEAFMQEHAPWTERDDAVGLTRTDVDGWLRDRAKDEGQRVNEAALSVQLDKLFPPGPLPDPQQVALRLPAILPDVLVP